MLKCELFCSGNSILQQDIEDIGKTNLNKNGKNKHYLITPIEDNEEEYIKQNDIYYNNINIKFPFEPYNEQIKYIQSIIDTLKNKEKTALESPTGTGKTLSLLTASLSFLHLNPELILIGLFQASLRGSRICSISDRIFPTSFQSGVLSIPFCSAVSLLMNSLNVKYLGLYMVFILLVHFYLCP